MPYPPFLGYPWPLPSPPPPKALGMKMRPEDFLVLEARIKPLDTAERREQYRAQGLSGKRYRWDLLRLSGLRIGDGKGAPGDLDLYAYLNDRNIDTALLRIVQPGLLK